MTPLLSFHAQDWYELKGRSAAVINDNPYLPELWEPAELQGQTVEIDGTLYVVKTVETFMINRTPSHPYKLSFGLIVEEADGPPPPR